MLLAIAAAIAAASTDSTLVVSVQTQNSFFRNGDDIGPMKCAALERRPPRQPQ